MPKGFYEEKCDNFSQKKFTGMNHQKNLVKAFDNLAPGVRGLCVFWQLGCGKTCAAIMVADNLLKKKEIDRVYVLSPGSLRKTWVVEYCEKCGIIQNINIFRCH